MSGPFGSSQWMYNSASGFYPQTIDQSLRFNDDDTAYLSRTPSSAGNRKTWTFSAWVKRTASLGSYQVLISAGFGGSGSGARLFLGFDSNARLITDIENIGSHNQSAGFYRDVGAWYHIVWEFDATNATAIDRSILYVNGERIQDNNPITFSNADYHFNNTIDHRIGYNTSAALFPLDAYMTEVNFVDGQALDPTSFGEFKSGVWVAKEYTGSYGTNGFYLDFSNSGSLGADSSGNGNNWTANNLAATDQVLDSPTNNFATFNARSKSSGVSLSEGNLDTDNATPNSSLHSTFFTSTGKWYAEFLCNSVGSRYEDGLGIATSEHPINSGFYSTEKLMAFRAGGNVTFSSFGSAIFPTWTAGDIVRLRLDLDNQTFGVAVNGGSFSDTTITNYDGHTAGELWSFCVHCGQNSGQGNFYYTSNFGQDSSFAGSKTAQGNTDDNSQGDFYYTPPSGYLALCAANLPVAESVDPAANNSPQDYFNAVTWSGTGSVQSITGVGFQPDFFWGKQRNANRGHILQDVVRGTTKVLNSHNANAEVTSTAQVTSFDADGFTLGTDPELNVAGGTHVGWNWRAGNGTSSNSDGATSSTVSANTQAGFSIVSWTGTGSSTTIGHGLNSTPELIINKNRSAAENWVVYSIAQPNGTQYLRLNSTSALVTDSSVFGASPTSSVFTVGTNPEGNGNGNNHIAYCFHSVDGFSAFGKYTGNGSTDGPYVYTGHRPAFVLMKHINGTNNWLIYDDERVGYNQENNFLYPNSSQQEDLANATGFPRIDILSNGFKLINNYGDINGSGGEYLYATFAHNPFKYALAR